MSAGQNSVLVAQPSRLKTSLIILTAAVFFAVIFTYYGLQIFRPPSRQLTEDDAGPPMPPGSTPFVWPGIQKPPLIAAAKAELAADHEIIGVLAEGRQRAYSVKGMSGMTQHVVNDLIGQTPVTVTYCVRTDYVQVFTANTLGKPLDVWTLGWAGELLLRSDNETFSQKTGYYKALAKSDQQPFPNLPFVRMKWNEWLALYPNSEVYLGGDLQSSTALPMNQQN